MKMAENEGNIEQEGSTGNETQEGGNNDNNQSVADITSDALNAKLVEQGELIKTINSKLSAANEESKGRRLENDQLKATIEANSRQKAGASQDLDEVRREYEGIFNNQKSEIATLTDQIRNNNVSGAISRAAVSAGAVKPSQVAQLINPFIGFDDNNVPYIKQNGSNQPAIDKDTGMPMTIETFTKRFLMENKHLLSSSGNAGAGSAKGQGAAAGGAVHTPEHIGNMTLDEYKKNRDIIHKQYSPSQ